MVRLAAIVAALIAVLVPAAPALGACGARKPANTGPRFTGKIVASRAASAHVADGRLSDWCGTGTNVAGKTTTSRGEFIYTDWLYDDHGPDLDGLRGQTQYRAALMPVLGDYRYPDDPKYGLNGADLRELRVAADRRGLHFLIALETLKVRDAAIVEIALDGARGGSGRWADGAGLTSTGAERFVTTWGAGARYTGPGGKTRRLRTAVNLRENAIEVDAPFGVIGRVSRRPRIWIAAGIDSGGRFRSIERGATAAFNVGLRTETYPRFGSAWNEQEQSKALARGDVTGFAGRFDLRRLEAGRSDPVRPLAPGFYNRIFRSRKDYGEGVKAKQIDPGHLNIGGSPDPEFLSRWQPYALYIPKNWTPSKRVPLTLNGHSLDCNMNEYSNAAPNQFTQLGDERGSIIFTPLARGSDTWYLDSGLVDVLEAWRDVRRHYKVDPERTAITGYSMGGYMTYRIGLLMPDRFSRASVYVGPPAYQYWPYPGPILPGDPVWTIPGNTNQIVENAYDLPYEIVHGNADELVPVNGVQHQADTFQAAGNDYRFFRHSADDHLSFILNDDWSRTRDWFGTVPRDKNPTTVVYRRYPSMDLPKDGLTFDHAYWVSDIEVRSAPAPDSAGEVHATTYGFGGNRKRPEPQPPTPVAGPTTPGTLFRQVQVAGDPITRSNGFEAELTNLKGVGFLVSRMGLDPHQPMTLHVTSDGPVDVTLFGDFGPVRAGSLPVAGTEGRVVITFPAGTTDVTVTPQ